MIKCIRTDNIGHMWSGLVFTEFLLFCYTYNQTKCFISIQWHKNRKWN